MKKLLLTLLIPIWLLATPKDPKVLFLHDKNHFSKVKANFIKKACEKTNIEMVYKGLGEVHNSKSKYDAYDLVVMQGVFSDSNKKMFNSILEAVKKDKTRVLALRVRDKNTTKWRLGIEEDQRKQINLYLGNGGERNFQSFADFMANDIFGISDKVADEPFIYPKTGIYHPDSPNGKIYESLKDYLKFMGVDKDAKKLVGIMMYQGNFGSMDAGLIDTTIKKLSQKENVLPVAFYAQRTSPKGKDVIPYKEIISIDGEVQIDAIVYYQMMHNGLQKKSEFERLGIPVFGGMTYRAGSEEDYKWEIQGIDNFMIPFMLNNPEIAGVVNPMIVAAKNEDDDTTQAIDYQIDAFLRRIDRYLVLQDKANKDKKVAWFFWSGDAGMGASNLNVAESFANIFKDLKEKGYDTKDINASYFDKGRVKDMMSLWYRDVNASDLLKRDLCELYPLDKYEKWFKALPDYVQTNITEAWGEPSSSNMLLEKDGKKYFTIPRMKLGNFIVLPQGSRSADKEEDQKSAHDKENPLNHGYLSVYLYAKEVFKADALVHMGTHGTQEWSAGKEKGLSIYDSPNLAAGDIPIFYPYIVDDVGEAIIAKRRGSAVVISHLTPPFAPAGLHDTLVVIHDLMHQYNEMTVGRTKQKTKERLIKLSEEENFDKEIDANATEDFEEYMKQLHDYLEELAEENQPLGLHTFGEDQEDNHQILTVMQMLGSKYANLANSKDIEIAGEKKDHDHDDGHSHDHKHGDKSNTDHSHEAGNKDIGNYKDINKSKPYLYIKATFAGNMPEDDDLKPYLEQAKKYKDMLRAKNETISLVDALDGKYIPSSTGGDPIRTPESLPTGRNLFGFDPSKIPTKAAFDAGMELAEQMIENYYKKHGVYPDKFAYTMFATETMRHYGVLESQILYTLGVRPIWSKSGRVTGVEIIPYSELKRPRVDVVVSATSLYRDSMPIIMDWIDKAVKMVVELKEESNFVRRNALALQEELEKKGLSKEDALKLSTIRIFSNAGGTSMGTGLARNVKNSGDWENDKAMSQEYMSRMGFAYGSGIHGKKMVKELFKMNLSGTDAVAFSRSSNLYGLLTADEPFQYFGGVAQAVRNIDGKTPEMYIMNLRNKDKAKVQDINSFISKELRTRYFHPQWIKAMQDEGSAGAGNFLSVIQNTWGWEVMAPESIRDDQWQEFVDVYVNDKHNLNMKEFFEKNNPEVLAKIAERFLEAIRKDYFKTDEETVKKLVETYMEMANKYDVFTDNEKFKEYVKGKALGYGLSTALPSKAQTKFITAEVKAAGEKPSKAKQKGQKLEEVKQTKIDKNYDYLYFLLTILAIIASGMIYQSKRRKEA